MYEQNNKKIITENPVSLPCSYSLSRRVRALFLFPTQKAFSSLILSYPSSSSPNLSLLPAENSNTQQIGIRALVFGLRLMAPETRSQDARRMVDSLEAVHQRINEIEVKIQAQSDDIAQLKAMMKEIATQQIAIQQTLQTLLGEANSSQNREMKIWASASEEGWPLPNGSDSLNCTKTLELKSSTEPGAEEAFCNQVVVLSQMGLILPANAKKNATYAVHLDYGPNPASTCLDYISEFTVTMPNLSLTGTSDVVHGQSVAQVYCVQTQAIQLVLKMAMLPKLSFGSGGGTYHPHKQPEKKSRDLIGGSLNLTLRTRLKSRRGYCHEWKRRRKEKTMRETKA